MARDAKRRRSLPSAVERNLSLHELLGGDDATRHAKRRKSRESQQQAALQSLNAYFAMIDQTELKVEQANEPEAATTAAPASPDASNSGGALSDSELVRPTMSSASRTQRTLRRRNLNDAKLQAEYAEYCDATGSVVTPLSIDEFARTIRPEVKSGMYDGILDVCPAQD